MFHFQFNLMFDFTFVLSSLHGITNTNGVYQQRAHGENFPYLHKPRYRSTPWVTASTCECGADATSCRPRGGTRSPGRRAGRHNGRQLVSMKCECVCACVSDCVCVCVCVCVRACLSISICVCTRVHVRVYIHPKKKIFSCFWWIHR